MTSEVSFTAIAEVTIDGQIHATPPIPFTMAGVEMILEVGKGADGAVAVNVRARQAARPATATFDKNCPQVVTYKLFRNGEPMQMVEVRSMFGAMSLDLSNAA